MTKAVTSHRKLQLLFVFTKVMVYVISSLLKPES